MLEQDYLMRQILRLIEAMVAARQKKDEELNPAAAADSLESAITAATELDGVALLSLSPESISSVMRVSGVDPGLASYIAHCILLESVYLREAACESLAQVREAQAQALAQSYGFELPDDPSDFEELRACARRAEKELWGLGEEGSDGQRTLPESASEADDSENSGSQVTVDILQSAAELERLL